jgi:uncharacterized protein (TIGR02001 family)
MLNRPNHTTLTRIALASAAALGITNASAQDDGPSSDRVSLAIDATWTSQYLFRGILQEGSGVIIQPSAELGFLLVDKDSFDLSLVAGVWNSFHDRATGSTTDDDTISKWYEFDWYAGVNAAWNRWGFGVAYTQYTSPNDAFSTTDEVSFTVAYDDSGHFGERFSINPSATLAVELDGQADGGTDEGIFLGLEIAPTWDLGDWKIGGVEIALPVKVGLSLGDYYEDSAGDDDTFGYLSIGAALNIDLPEPEGFGDWSAHAGVEYLALGDSTEEINGSDDEWIFSAGIGASF